MQFHPLETLDDWKAFQSLHKSRFILKLSPICPISYSAERRVEKWLESLAPETDLVYATLDVIDNRSLSRAIATDLNVNHESPQAIFIDQSGMVLWHASHHRIKLDALNALELGNG